MKFQKVITLLTTALIAFSCGNSYVLSPEQLEEVLVDMHLAEGVALGVVKDFSKSGSKVDLYTTVYVKHGTDKAHFDSTMSYYSEDLVTLSEVYDNVFSRIVELEKQAQAGDFSVSKKISSPSAYSRISKEDIDLLPYIEDEFWKSKRDLHFNNKIFAEGKSFTFTPDSLEFPNALLRFTLTSDSLKSASCHVDVNYAEDTQSFDFDLLEDDSKTISLKWSLTGTPRSIDVSFESEKLNKNSKLRLKDIRLYNLSEDKHSITLF